MVSTAEWLADELARRTKEETVARNAAIFASSDAKPYVIPAPKPIEVKIKRVRVVGSIVIHIAPAIGTGVVLKALCGLERGRACKDPATTTLTVDRYCSNCWRVYAQPRLVA